ncbi:MAG: hypothetical protein KDJ14_13675 [Xanthomonadales bacterium]|nr:hypothetical protein [Xanthomonadales bacterium]
MRSALHTGLVTSLLLTGAACSVGVLISGSDLLELLLPGGLPLGNLVAALALACLSAAALVLTPPHGLAHWSAVAVFAACLCWLPVSIAMAGNPNLNFANGRGELWIQFSAVLVAAAWCMLVLGALLRLIAWRRPAVRD